MPRETLDILIVEDAPEMQNLIALYFKGTPLPNVRFNPTVVRDSKTAFAALKKKDFQPRLIISDYRLPGEKSGLQLLIEVQEKYKLPGVLFTCDTNEQLIALAQQSGIHYIPKDPNAMRTLPYAARDIIRKAM